jgi:hypothetical protein
VAAQHHRRSAPANITTAAAGVFVEHSGQLQVYASPIPATGEQWQLSSSGGEHLQWRGDGRELFFMAPDGSMMPSRSIDLS